LLPRLHRIERDRALASYCDAAFEIAPLPCNRPGYGEFLRDDDAIHAGSWSEYLLARMRRSLDASPWLAIDVTQLDVIVDALAERIRALPPAPPTLVHGDYFPGNVLMSDALTVAGVIDFGPLTVIGDPALDLVSALIFLEMVPGNTSDDTEFVRARLTARVGPAMLDAITTYRGWYATRFAPYRDDDPKLYAWCVHSLREIARTLLAG
jgi:putative membrane protein